MFSSAYHPQTDGKAQRAHRTIEQAIRGMLAEHSLPPDNWCKVVGPLELGLNSANTENTGKPPTLGAFWELPGLPVDVFVGAGQYVGADQVAMQVRIIMEEARK